MIKKTTIRSKITRYLQKSTNTEVHIPYTDKIIAQKIKLTKNFLRAHDDIFFTKADKGNVTVCLKKNRLQ